MDGESDGWLVLRWVEQQQAADRVLATGLRRLGGSGTSISRGANGHEEMQGSKEPLCLTGP